MVRNAKRNSAFTLLEVILTISLTALVLVLLATVLELLLFRVEASRSRVESSQLARGVLNRIANDLRAARYTPSSKSSESDSNSSSESEEESETEDSTSLGLGIYGTAKQLRIDRSAVWRWERISRNDDDEEEDTISAEMPQTVRYFLNEGETVLVESLAAEGIHDEETVLGYAGLSREQMSTVAWILQSDASKTDESEANTEDAQLLAPEVLDIEFAYFDGQELLDEWDTAEQGGLPHAVEITLKLANEPVVDISKRQPDDPEELQPQLEDATEYRLFVRIPKLEPQSGVPGPRRVEKKSE